MNKVKELNTQNDNFIPGYIVKTTFNFYILTDKFTLVNLKTGEIESGKYYKIQDVADYECHYYDAEITIH